MMVVRAFIQQQDRRKLRHEEQLVVEELERQGIPIFFYTVKQIRRQLPLDRQSTDNFGVEKSDRLKLILIRSPACCQT